MSQSVGNMINTKSQNGLNKIEEEQKISTSQIVNQTTGLSSTNKSIISPNTDQQGSSNYTVEMINGNGTFGVVYLASITDTGEKVAIQKVFQDKRFKNRELQIIKDLSHTNVIKLRHAFYTSGDNPEEVYLNLVMDYVPETLSKIIRSNRKKKQSFPPAYIKVYSYQMFRALAYLQSIGICHRDIQPQNILVDPSTLLLQICDFGSAQKFVKGEPSVAYICSRYYRAPQLIFGATQYGFAIDTWSIGCVIAEMILWEPLFPGESAVDQLVEIIKILGTPTMEQVQLMNPNHTEFKFPQIKAHPWNKVFLKQKPDPLLVDLISQILCYSPKDRLKPLEVLAHPYFNELRQQGFQITHISIPDLFDFTPEEISIQPEMKSQLIPTWQKN